MNIKQEIVDTIGTIEAAKAAGDMVEAAHWNRQLAILREREFIYDSILTSIQELEEAAASNGYGNSYTEGWVHGVMRGLKLALDIVQGEG